MTDSNRVRLSRLSLALIVALAAAPAFAQSTSANLGGTVVGADGRPVGGAEVTITHVESGTVNRVVTDADGRYNARGLRVGGPYTIAVNKTGAGTDTEQNVYLQIAPNSVNLNLAGASVLDTVTVVGAGVDSVFSATKMGAGTSVDQRTIQTLPSIAGNIQDFMRLDPRVAFTDRASGSISAGGQNPRFNKISIDGVSASDTFGIEGNNMPTQRQPVSMEAIEALDVSLSNYDVTVAGAAGANINAVTKSGGNTFHGSVYGTMRDGDWFGKHPQTGAKFKEFTDEQTYGFTLGGPIVKDKLFFFANYEKFERGKPTPDLANTPLGPNGGDFTTADLAELQRIAKDKWGFDAGGLTGNGNTELEEYALKLDWNINDNHRASLRYSKLEQVRVRPEGSGGTVLALNTNWFDHEKTVESYVGQVFSDWTDNFSTEFKVSFRDYSAIRVNPSTLPVMQVFFDNDRNAANGFQSGGDSIRFGTEFSSMGNALLTETWNYFGAATWTLGDHDVKFGAEYSDNDIYNFFLQNFWGSYTFDGLTNFNNGQYSSYAVAKETSPGSAAARYSNQNLGLFVQDTWYVNSNLTLTFGVRGDRPNADPDPAFNSCFASMRVPNGTGPASCPNGGFGLDNTNTFSGNFLIQPRFGFNYSFDSERPTQLRGGVGLFQGDAPQVWVGNAYNSTGLNFISFSNITAFQTVRFTPDGLNQPTPPAGTANRNVNVITDGFDLPSVWKANLALDHELPWYGIVASAELLLSDVKNGLFYRSLNVGPGFISPVDGRALYWDPAAPAWDPNNLSGSARTTWLANTSRFRRNSFFGDVYELNNTNKGKSQQLTLSLSKPFSTDSDWSWTLGYTYTHATEVGSLTSSTAGSGYGSQLGFNINEEASNTARYEIKDRFSGSLNWKHAFFGDYETQVGLVYEGRSGRPFSYIFNNDANGDNRTFNDLFYVPKGPGDVKFGTLSSTGVFVADPVMEKRFWDWLYSNPDLAMYMGSHAPENAFRAGWVNSFDLRLTQELPGFFKGHKSKIWVDIQNVGNLINKDWGHVLDYGFNANNPVATLRGIHQGKYVYGYRSGTEFGQASAFGVPADADQLTQGISQWSAQVGFKYEF